MCYVRLSIDIIKSMGDFNLNTRSNQAIDIVYQGFIWGGGGGGGTLGMVPPLSRKVPPQNKNMQA